MICMFKLLVDTGQPRSHAADRPSTRLGEPSSVLGSVEGGGQTVLSCWSWGVVVYGFMPLQSEWPFIVCVCVC